MLASPTSRELRSGRKKMSGAEVFLPTESEHSIFTNILEEEVSPDRKRKITEEIYKARQQKYWDMLCILAGAMHVSMPEIIPYEVFDNEAFEGIQKNLKAEKRAERLSTKSYCRFLRTLEDFFPERRAEYEGNFPSRRAFDQKLGMQSYYQRQEKWDDLYALMYKFQILMPDRRSEWICDRESFEGLKKDLKEKRSQAKEKQGKRKPELAVRAWVGILNEASWAAVLQPEWKDELLDDELEGAARSVLRYLDTQKGSQQFAIAMEPIALLEARKVEISRPGKIEVYPASSPISSLPSLPKMKEY